ncbi:hypothetical protein HYC85_013420 [Camellia sinensis]|uniref:Late embryogenesis abundant protein LEA-2 subgroup domain-containing protein n=1 Tax=Camellia sinensis TaxID=4442 RepID=A0A7J7H3A7_CAMSI|nr:hypothetical protein HYC85_013420 [Camellia sinensis]
MSQVLTRSPKHCAKQGLKNIDEHYKKLFYAFSTFFLSILFLIFLVWLILHPSKPEFSLKEADLYQLNLTAPLPHLLNSSIQFTLLSKNPNKKVGIYYDELQVYASYKGQQITVGTSLPPFYQDHDESNLLAGSLTGTGELYLNDLVHINSRQMNGRLRWKVGTWVSGRNRFNANCVAVVDFRTSGQLSSKQGTQCSTTV